MSLPPEIITPRDERHGSRLGDIVRRLSLSSDGEIVATVYAMRRTLESVGTDLHGLAAHLEASNGKQIPEEKLQRVWDAAYARGVQDTENKQHGSDDFRHRWQANVGNGRALSPAQQAPPRPEASRIYRRHGSATAWGHEPTERQHKYLHSLFYKLGGKIT